MGAIDTLLAGTAPAFKFSKPGDSVVGEVLGISEQQDSDYDDPKLLKWWNRDDGPDRGNPADRPKMILVFTLQTTLTDGSGEDDGIRSIWARGHCITAIRAALRKTLGARYTEDELIGGDLWVCHSALGTPKPRMHPPKLFEAKFRRVNRVETAADAVEQNEPDGRPTPPTTASPW